MKAPDASISVIPLEQAIEAVNGIAMEVGLRPRQEEIFQSIVKSIPLEGDAKMPFVRIDKLKIFAANFMKAVKTGDSTFLNQERGLCVDRIVDIEEFVESSSYMNQKGYVRPAIMRKLLDLFVDPNRYIEIVATGAIGIGKNYFADLVMAYQLYLLSCYHNPQIEFDLAPGSSIVFIEQSMSLTLAKKVVFGQFSERLKLSPYFQQRFPFDPGVRSELRFPKNIYVIPVGGQDTGAIGMNVYGGIIDEMNFMARTTNSVKTQYTGEEEYDQAERLYRSLIRRMKSRFMSLGKLPGKLLLVSSTNYPDDFTDRKLKEAETDPTIFVMKYSQWEALPQDRFCGDKFLVEVGNEVKQSRILRRREEALDEEDIVEVPIEYRSEFERDLEAALRDLGGVATGTKHPFIPQRELIEKAQSTFEVISNYQQLFTMETATLSQLMDPSSPDWETIINYDYIEQQIDSPEVPFSVHIDPGLTNDAAGIAIARITGYRLLPSFTYYNERMGEFTEVRDVRAPVYTVDGVLQITAPPNGEVDLELVRDMVLHLRGMLNIKYATMDSYQSAMMIQGFRKGRIKSGVLSVDTNIAPYAEYKQAIKDERILIPRHAVLARETRELERDPEKDRIDHPNGGSKDCSDAVAGAVYLQMKKEARYGQTARGRGRSTVPQAAERQVRKIRIRGGPTR